MSAGPGPASPQAPERKAPEDPRRDTRLRRWRRKVKRAARAVAEYIKRQEERLVMREYRKREFYKRLGRRIAAGRDTARNHLSDLRRHHLPAARARASNAWYRAAGRRISGTRQGIRNQRNQRTLERGRRPRVTQAADAARSSLPVYRNRTDPATGRPNRDRAALGRTQDASLARMAPRVRADRAARPGRSPR